MARDDAFKVAMATDDTATLKVFLQTYPKGALADQIRGRLRGLEPQRTSRLLLIGCLLGLALIIGFVTWPWVIRTSDDAGSVATKLNSDVSVVATQTDVTDPSRSQPPKPDTTAATQTGITDAPHSQPPKPDTTAATQTGITDAPHSQPLPNDATNGNQVTILRGHEDLVFDAAFSRDGARIVTASQDDTARIWDAASAKEVVVLRGSNVRFFSAEFSPDGARILTATSGHVASWSAHGAQSQDRAAPVFRRRATQCSLGRSNARSAPHSLTELSATVSNTA
jgi:hypothetical protein